MFQQQMKKYKRYSPKETVNEFNETEVTYELLDEIEMAVALDTYADYQNNDSNLTQTVYAGLTRVRNVKKGQKIDDMIVTFVQNNRLYSIVYLKDVNNDGCE